MYELTFCSNNLNMFGKWNVDFDEAVDAGNF